MTKRMLLSMAVAAAALATGHAASAETSVTIGVLNDRSGLYADLSGEGVKPRGINVALFVVVCGGDKLDSGSVDERPNRRDRGRRPAAAAVRR